MGTLKLGMGTLKLGMGTQLLVDRLDYLINKPNHGENDSSRF